MAVKDGVQIIGLDELVDHLDATAMRFNRIVVRELRPLGEFVAFLCKVELADTKYTGELESSFVVVADTAKGQVEIFPQAKQGLWIRKGTKPHWAPIGPLKAWAAVKLGDAKLAWAVQWSIKEEGTSVFSERKRGTKSNPWPRRVVGRGDFRTALRRTAERIGVELVEEITA